MIKVLYGIQSELIENYINNFIESQKINNIIKIDYYDSNIESIIEECSYLDLFGNNKLVIVNNASFLTSEETLNSKEFNNYIETPLESTTLFLITNNDKLDIRKKVVKTLKEKYEILEFNKFNEYEAINYVKNKIKKDGYIIENEAVKKMVEFLSTNFGLYNNEINKLELYKLEEKEIMLEDVLLLTTRIPEDNIFNLLDAVIVNDKNRIFKLYKDIKFNGIDEILLLANLSSHFRFYYQVKILLDGGKTKYEIISILNSHPYKTELAIKKVPLFKKEKLKEILYNLSNIDINIKLGFMDKKTALEDFFLNL